MAYEKSKMIVFLVFLACALGVNGVPLAMAQNSEDDAKVNVIVTCALIIQMTDDEANCCLYRKYKDGNYRKCLGFNEKEFENKYPLYIRSTVRNVIEERNRTISLPVPEQILNHETIMRIICSRVINKSGTSGHCCLMSAYKLRNREECNLYNERSINGLASHIREDILNYIGQYDSTLPRSIGIELK